MPAAKKKTAAKKSTKRSLKGGKSKLFVWVSRFGYNGHPETFTVSNKPPSADNTGNLSPAAKATSHNQYCSTFAKMMGFPVKALKKKEVLELEAVFKNHCTYKVKVDITKQDVK